VNKSNLGFKVKIKFSPEGIFGATTQINRNVTEIHYNYNDSSGIPIKVAFESDIHRTGLTYYMTDIKEFEATVETELAQEF